MSPDNTAVASPSAGPETPADTPALTISANAAKRVSFLKSQEGNPDLMLRLSVSGGGCAGFQYHFDFDTTRHDDDVCFQKDDVTVVVDEMSLGLLAGSELDYVEDLIGAAFQIRNPNASSSCGCGSSFSL